MMRRAVFCAVLCAGLCAAAVATLPAPPGGYKVDEGYAQMMAMYKSLGADGVSATKPNDGWPQCFVDPKVRLGYNIGLTPGSQANIDMMLKAPEEPATEKNNLKDEPAGKQGYKGGVITWRKWSYRVIGSNCGHEWVVVWNASWAGMVGKKMGAVGLGNYYGDRSGAQQIMDTYIDAVKNSGNSMPAKQ